MELERGSTRSHTEKNSLCKRLWNFRKTDCVENSNVIYVLTHRLTNNSNAHKKVRYILNLYLSEWNFELVVIELTWTGYRAHGRNKVKLKCALVHAVRLCTGRRTHSGSTDIVLPFLDHGTRKRWGVSVTPRPIFIPGNDPVPIVQEAGWAPGLVWTGAKNPSASPLPNCFKPVHRFCTEICPEGLGNIFENVEFSNADLLHMIFSSLTIANAHFRTLHRNVCWNRVAGNWQLMWPRDSIWGASVQVS
jgi:hypothetical protein